MVIERETDVDDPEGIWSSVPIMDQVKLYVDWAKVAKEFIRGNP